jgi:hypothetical protein
MDKTPEQLMAEMVLEDGGASGRKLKFHEQCAAFALLYGRIKPRIVARAFGVSAATVSHIGGCLEQDPDPTRRRIVFKGSHFEERIDTRDHNQGRSMNRALHYETVAREFEALGVAEFNRRYLTNEVMERVKRARAQLRAEKLIPPIVEGAAEPDMRNWSVQQILAWRKAEAQNKDDERAARAEATNEQ